MNIPYLLFKKVTNNFAHDRIIGTGGFGNVYKGVLANGELIAVKLIHPLKGVDDTLFKNEVCNLFEVDHPNIVGLLGYCDEIHYEYFEHEGEKARLKKIYRVLCFEYFSRGSLDKHLQEKSLGPDWRTRYNIIKGICEGLNYLHGRESPIFHLDLKPGNILLDSLMLPKLADFGLSRLFRESNSHVTQQLIGTNNYMPQEYRNGGQISNKYDVFSLGVVMIEIIGGSEGYSLYQEMNDVTQFKQEVLKKWGRIIEPTSEQLLQVVRCIDTALCCVDLQREKRPTIASILDTLNKTETGISKTQLSVVSLSPAKNSVAETLKNMIVKLDNITISEAQKVHDRRDASSNLEKPLIIRKTIGRVTTSSVEAESIIGRNEDKQKILSILSQSSTIQMTILPIYGIGGIGKTTLAQFLFNDTQFSGYSRVWVYVSEKIDFYKIGNSIISQLSKGKSDTNDMQVLHNNLAEQFANKRIFIVLDDLWENSKPVLHELKKMLRLGNGNKVIITTRDRNICCNVKPYKLEILTDDMCWSIIKQESKFEDLYDKIHLEPVGRDIAIKCGGVPLAARSLGYMLGDMALGEWESVRDNHIWNSSSSEDPSLPTHDVLASLRLSYSYMEKFLKFCFTYCGVFPKGYNLVKCDLIHQWIALELTGPSKPFDSIQRCEQYITQLLRLSFLQYSNTPSNGGEYATTSFTMHDLVHDLATEILADNNENGDVLGSNYHYVLLPDPNNPLSFPGNIKALHLDCGYKENGGEYATSLIMPDLLHDLATKILAGNNKNGDVLGSSYQYALLNNPLSSHVKALHLDCGYKKVPDDIFSPAENLLVLHIRNCGNHKLPNSFGKLKQLRYLSAPWVEDSRIAEVVKNLPKLNYLNLYGSSIFALPDSIGDMKGLMHLDLTYCKFISDLPVSFFDLTELVFLDLSQCAWSLPTSKSWGGFTKLQYLNLSKYVYSPSYEVLPEAIGKLTKLEYLNISYFVRFHDNKELSAAIQVFRKLIKLRYLNLAGCMCTLSEADIHSLLVGISTLYNLEHLDLTQSHNLKNIPEIIVSLMKLHTLDLSNCNVNKLPAWIAKMASLKIVHLTTIDHCTSNLVLFTAVNPSKLKISKLEDVKSPEEAQSIKLIEKRRMVELELEWTVGSHKRSVEDKDVLEKLVPPNTIKRLEITGYMSVSFPENWLMGIGKYLCNVEKITLQDLPKCNNLPPLGLLPKLGRLSLYRLGSLGELNTEDSCGELMFPSLDRLHIMACPKLRLKPRLPRLLWKLFIDGSDNMLTSWGDCVSQSSSPRVWNLVVRGSTMPMDEWSLRLDGYDYRSILCVRYCSDLALCSPGLSSVKSLDIRDDILTELPTCFLELTSLTHLTIKAPKLEKLNDSTRQLTTGLESLILSGCRNMVSLPQWIGELTSLEELKICWCEGIRSLPGSIRQLTKLKILVSGSFYHCYAYELRRMLSSIPADMDEVNILEFSANYIKKGKALKSNEEDSNSDEESTEVDIKIHEEEAIYVNPQKKTLKSTKKKKTHRRRHRRA